MRRAVAVLLAAGALGGCQGPRDAIALLQAKDSLVEAKVAGRDRTWVLNQAGKGMRLDDVVYLTLPASPPSRLVYRLDLPVGGHLRFACGIPSDRHDRPGVAYSVKVRRGSQERIVWNLVFDPGRKHAHRRWFPVDVDLSAYSGRGADLILETQGFEEANDARRAFWGTPMITVPRDQAPVAIVYLVDTLRADHTTPYGYARNTTPRLQEFAKDAVVFETAIAQASWTKPSVASILTSTLPGRHRAVQLRDVLDPGVTTLPEMLAAKGWVTGASISNSVIYSEGLNFEQGFDWYAGIHGAKDRPSKDVEAGPVVDAALKWLSTRGGLPTFLYVHPMDPHVPYTPPAPFDRAFEPHPTPEHPATDPRNDYKEPLDRERLIAQYDGEIAYGDQEFGRFIRTLKERGLYHRALIVFMADHGEEFEDHGKWLHGRSVFDELVRIPLIVKFPGSRDAGRRVTQQVQSMDVFPTVLEEGGLPVPPLPVINGHPLQEVVRGGAPEPPAVSEISHRGNVAHGIRTGHDKYIQRFSPEEDELYFDLVKDPKERNSLLEQSAERVRALRADVEAAMVPNPYRHVLRFVGGSAFEVEVKTRGWIDAVEPVGFAGGDRYELLGNGRRLELRVHPKPGTSREVAFGVRPMGAPVTLTGTRDGRGLRPPDVLMAKEGIHPAGTLPFRLPDIETEAERSEDVYAPPPEELPGLHVWLHLPPGRKKPERFDKETCERLKALGYVNTCAP